MSYRPIGARAKADRTGQESRGAKEVELYNLFPEESLVVSRSGMWRIQTTTTMATAPMGRLMPKHHRQVTLDVKAPPISGPMMDEAAKDGSKRP